MIRMILGFFICFCLLSYFVPNCVTNSVKTVEKGGKSIKQNGKKTVKRVGRYLAGL